MFENPRRGRQARNFTTNAPKILDLKSSSEQIFSRKLPLGAPVVRGNGIASLLSESRKLYLRSNHITPLNIFRGHAMVYLAVTWCWLTTYWAFSLTNDKGVSNKKTCVTMQSSIIIFACFIYFVVCKTVLALLCRTYLESCCWTEP